MRLDDFTRVKIIDSVKAVLADYPGELRLYGSRVNDDLRGGDIDLVFILKPPGKKIDVTIGVHVVTSAIKMAIGEQKIDFSIVDELGTKEPFWTMALEQSLVLASW